MQNFQFIFSIFALVAIARSAAISNTGFQGVDKRDNTGFIGKERCDAISERFFKFGECISATPQFQYLNQTFWYQAARKELCGYDMEYHWPTPDEQQGRNGTEDKSALLKLLNINQKQMGSSGNSAEDFQLASEAELLYLNKLKVEGNNNMTAFVDKRDIKKFITSQQCVSLCNSMQEISNQVDECWQVTSLTVLYGVCEVGCAYFF